MEKSNHKEIPRSIIKGGNSIHTDFDLLDGKTTLLFVSPNCTVVGLKNVPYMLFTTPDFNTNVLPLKIRKDIYEVKQLVLQPSFSSEIRESVAYCAIPKWLTNFKKLELLRFEYVELAELSSLNNLPIQNLIFENIKYEDSQKLIDAIKQFKHLEEVSYDHSLGAELIRSVKKLNLKLTVISD